jgi:hypothetical protein
MDRFNVSGSLCVPLDTESNSDSHSSNNQDHPHSAYYDVESFWGQFVPETRKEPDKGRIPGYDTGPGPGREGDRVHRADGKDTHRVRRAHGCGPGDEQGWIDGGDRETKKYVAISNAFLQLGRRRRWLALSYEEVNAKHDKDRAAKKSRSW